MRVCRSPSVPDGEARLRERSNVDGLKARLCAELLSSLSQCRLPQKSGDSETTEPRETALAPPRQIYEDEDVLDFVQRIDSLATKTGCPPAPSSTSTACLGIIPPLILSCVLNASLHSDHAPKLSAADPGRALYVGIWSMGGFSEREGWTVEPCPVRSGLAPPFAQLHVRDR